MIASMRLLYQIPVAYYKLPDRDETAELSARSGKRWILSRLKAKISFGPALPQPSCLDILTQLAPRRGFESRVGANNH